MPLNMKAIQIILPSMLRSTIKAYALKAEIRELGGELTRIGRSRNWQLKATREQLDVISLAIDAHNEPSWYWVAKKLRAHVTYTTFDSLLHVAKKTPGITVNELMSKTDCTIAQARKVIDELEFM